MLWSVWLVICFRFLLFIIVKVFIWCINLLVICIIICFVEVIVYFGCIILFICFCNFVNGIICNLIGLICLVKICVNLIIFFFVWLFVNGGLWKWIVLIVMFCFIIFILVIGEFMFFESISNVLLFVFIGKLLVLVIIFLYI